MFVLLSFFFAILFSVLFRFTDSAFSKLGPIQLIPNTYIVPCFFGSPSWQSLRTSILARFLDSIFSFMCIFCRSMFVLLSFFFAILLCPF
jgi:hypothetical protein